MITFEEYAKTYHRNVKPNSFDYKHLNNEFEAQSENLKLLDKDKVYTEEDLAQPLFHNLNIRSQSSFYRYLRGYHRVASLMQFNYETVAAIDRIKFENIFDKENFASEYFGSLSEIFSTIDNIQRLNRLRNREPAKVVTGLMWSGLQSLEIMNLKEQDIDLKNNTVKVTRDEKEITIQIEPEVADEIHIFSKEKKRKGIYLFTGRNGGKACPTVANKTIKLLADPGNPDGKVFFTDNIIYSGMFCRAYNNNEALENAPKDLKMKYDLWVKTFRAGK